VSGPGETPFLLGPGDWTWEDLGATLPNITYTVLRSDRPQGTFRSVRDGYVAPSWVGDPDLPSGAGARVFYYLVTANDGTADSGAGTTTPGDPRDVEWPPRCAGGGAPLSEPVPYEAVEMPWPFANPIFVTAPPGDTSRLFVVERAGRIRIVDLATGTLLPTPFLDISPMVRTGSERGLLGLAFHPQYATNGLFYIHYSSTQGGCADHCARVSEFAVSADPNVADAASERVLLVVSQPAGNHDGGWIDFGPDGYLYVAFGDGGGRDDQFGNGQNLGSLLATLLRLDVNGRDPGLEYAIPPDNPFVGQPGALPEIWAYGLRNPWRCSFDRATGDLWIADVGQNAWEEIDVADAAAGGGAGANYGWSVLEGTHCFPSPPCDPTPHVAPIYEYSHAEGCSISGGYVYRGCRMPFLQGRYFFADYCGGWVRSLVLDAGAATDVQDHAALAVASPASFGQDADGELYVVSIQGGRIYRIEPRF